MLFQVIRLLLILFVVDRSVVTNCGTTVSMTGTLPCVAPNTCVNNACQACVVSSYTPALNTFCDTRNVVTNCGTTVSMTGTLNCTFPQTCGGGGIPNVCGAESCTTDNQATACDDNNECTTDTCPSGSCVNSNFVDMTNCSSNNGRCCGGVCDSVLGNSNFAVECRKRSCMFRGELAI